MALKSKTNQSTAYLYDYVWPNYTGFTRLLSEKNVYVPLASQNNPNRKTWTNWSYKVTNAAGGAPETTQWNWGNVGVYPAVVWKRYEPPNHTYTSMLYGGALMWDPPGALMTEADNIAQAKLFQSLKDSRAQWNLAVSLGEARETAAHIAHTARRLADSYRALRRTDFVGFYNALFGAPPKRQHVLHWRRAIDKRRNDAASAWMEYQYGWFPLVMDIHNAAEYLARKSVGHSWSSVKIKRKHSVEERGSYDILGTYSYSPTYREVYKNYATVGYSYDVAPKYLRQPSTLEELGFTNPASLVWELLPLSFVTDWFVNVGQVLESLHEFNQWEVRRGLRFSKGGYVRDRTLSKDWSYSVPVHQKSAEMQYARQKLHQATFTRTVMSTLPTAVPLRIKVDNPFDLKSGVMASAAALLSMTFNQTDFYKRIR